MGHTYIYDERRNELQFSIKEAQLVCHKLHLHMQLKCIKKIIHLRVLKSLRSNTNMEILSETKICFNPL